MSGEITLLGSLVIFILAVLVGFDPNGEILRYASFLGGSRTDHGRHLAIHPDGTIVFVVGETGSTDFPLAAAASEVPSGWFLSAFRVRQTSNSKAIAEFARWLKVFEEHFPYLEGRQRRTAK